MSEEKNKNLRARKTLVQLSALNTDLESHNAQRYRQMGRRTDGRLDDGNSRSYCVAVRSALRAVLSHGGPHDAAVNFWYIQGGPKKVSQIIFAITLSTASQFP